MPLKLNGEDKSLFSHNREYDEGVNQRGIRPGQATVVVALDGSGDAESIQEGIDMLPKTGGEVYVKEGTYNITTEIKIFTNDINLTGSGFGTIISVSTGTAPLEIRGNNIIISDLKFVGNKTSPEAIIISLGINTTIKNCYMYQLWRGIYTQVGTITSINNFIEDMGHVGILVGMIIGGPYINQIITNNKIWNCDDDGIRMNKTDKSIISNNIITTNAETGINIDANSDNNVIMGNVLDSNTTANLTNNGAGNIIEHNISV